MNLLEPPAGILDLIPWHPSLDDRDAEASDLQPRPWSELPDEILHSVLARLPFQTILRFRSVCRQWKALFSSHSFYHLPSHRPHIRPWIFFLGTRYRRRGPYDGEESDSDFHYDDGRDDKGFVFDGFEHCSGDTDSNNNVSDVSGDMQDGEHGDIYGAMMPDGHESMHEVSDSADTHDVGMRSAMGVNDFEAFEELLLIFDCESESWLPPLTMPLGFRSRPGTPSFFARFDVCSFQDYILIPTCSDENRFFLFNPAAPLRKELPPYIAEEYLEGLGLSAEIITTRRASVAGDLPSLSNWSSEKLVENMVDISFQVVVVEKKIYKDMDMCVVKSFSSITGFWHICGYLDDLVFTQRQMMFHKGSFYAMTTKGVLKMDILQGGQNMECTFRETPITTSDNDAPDVLLTESRLLGTKDSLFMIGVTYTYIPYTNEIEEWDILIWKYLPYAADDACWQFQAYAPKPILEDYFGDIEKLDVISISCLAHGDLIFVAIPNRHRFLIYELHTKVWRFSGKCKWFLASMAFIWEPLLRNSGL